VFYKDMYDFVIARLHQLLETSYRRNALFIEAGYRVFTWREESLLQKN